MGISIDLYCEKTYFRAFYTGLAILKTDCVRFGHILQKSSFCISIYCTYKEKDVMTSIAPVPL